MYKRQIAIATGIALLIMAITAGFSWGYAYIKFDNPEQFEVMKDNIVQYKGLYCSMIIGILIIIIFDFIVSYTLYKYFEEESKQISLISGVLRATYTVIFGMATYYLIMNISADELTNQLVKSNFDLFQTIWNSGLVVFGFHILLVGYLMKLHLKIPKILWYITLVAGISYVIVSLSKLESPNSEMVKNLEMILALPMVVGELGLAVWLLVKGGK
jgi:MFS family permease